LIVLLTVNQRCGFERCLLPDTNSDHGSYLHQALARLNYRRRFTTKIIAYSVKQKIELYVFQIVYDKCSSKVKNMTTNEDNYSNM
jgi:hypothetical protein